MPNVNFEGKKTKTKKTACHILASNVLGKLSPIEVKVEAFLIPSNSQVSWNGWLLHEVLSEF